MEANAEERKAILYRMKGVALFFVIMLVLAVAGAYAAGGAEEAPAVIGSPSGAYDINAYSPVTDNDTLVSEEGAIPASEELLEAGPLGGGTYLFSGDYGRTVVIDAHDEIVHLILDGANIRTYDGPAILVRSAAKVIITAKEGTESSLADCAYYSERNIYAAI
ncbi:MAG TPA: hypothetical protein DCL38_07510, partial [Lachnospiraceae bacterium]|nr:hypothetical protein [Lachnospiraceae bacterium]